MPPPSHQPALVGQGRAGGEDARDDEKHRRRGGHEPAQGFKLAATAEYGVAGDPDQRDDAQRRVQRIDRADAIQDRENHQIDELQNRPGMQEAGRPARSKVDGRPPPRFRQEKKTGRQVAGGTQTERSPKYFTHG
jgi:hypothetical protein